MKKIWIYIIFGIVLILSSLFIYIKSVIDTIEFEFDVDDVLLKKLDFKSLNLGTGFVEIKLLLMIRYYGLFNVSISDLNLKVYYLDKLVVRTTNNIDNKEKIYLINEVKNKFFHTFDLQVNSSTIELVYKIQNDLKYFINYELSFKILGLTINYKGKYENN
jgi:hypothetical protein